MSEVKHWFALYTKPRHEFKAQIQFESENIAYYLPTITRLKQWSDRKKKVIEPLFKGYIFIEATEKERLLAVEFNSIVKTIFFGGKPSIIPDYQINNLKTLLSNTNKVEVYHEIIKGNTIKITEGPFEGVEGVVYDVGKNDAMLAVNIDLLRRSVVVKIPASDVRKKD
jgi:transcription antitermination factor NusG